jgi:HD-GYP domain-containing protein (c-di-GMP phosphodiesterase class II)
MTLLQASCPEGREGEQIPLGARIVGLADAYVALTADRPYRAACSSREALETLAATQGIWFEARLLDALTKVVNANPRVSHSVSR